MIFKLKPKLKQHVSFIIWMWIWSRLTMSLTYCILETPKQVLSVTEIHRNLETSTYAPLKYTMGSPILIVSICKGKSIIIHRVKQLFGECIGPVKRFFEHKIAIIFLFIGLNMCFGCSKEPSHWDGSFEYPYHKFWLRNKKKFKHTLLSGGLRMACDIDQ